MSTNNEPGGAWDQQREIERLSPQRAAPPDTGLAGLREALDALYTAELDRLLEADEGWNMLDPRHNARVDRWHVAMDKAHAALAVQVPEPSLDAAWREVEAVIAAARRVSEVSVTVEAVRVAYGTPKTGSALFMALGELDYAIGALDNATRLRAAPEDRTEGLDVERLAVVLEANESLQITEDGGGDGPSPEWFEVLASEIAAEYARLTPDRTPTEEER